MTQPKEKPTACNVPKLRFPEFLDKKEWEIKHLGELFYDRQESGFTFLSLLSLTDKEGVIPQEDSNRKNNSNADKTKYLRVVPGDIAYNTMRMWEGRSAFVGMEGLVSPAYTVCKPRDGISGLFFSYYFKTRHLIDEFKRYSQGLVKDTLNLKFSAFSKIYAAYPALSEQQKIADCLASLDELIAAQAQQLDTLKTHKKGLMQQLFPAEGETAPRLRFPEFLDAGEWESFPLSKFVKALDAGVSVNSGDRPAMSDENGILKTSAVTNGVFKPLENKVVLEKNEIQRLQESVCVDTIIISRMNTPALVGANAYVEASLKNLFLPDRLWAAKPKPGTSMRFIAYILSSAKKHSALSELATGTSGSMKNIKKADILTLKISAPSLQEQQKIADCLSSLDELIRAQTQKLDALKTHKKGLMQQLFPQTPAESTP